MLAVALLFEQRHIWHAGFFFSAAEESLVPTSYSTIIILDKVLTLPNSHSGDVVELHG